MNGIFQGLPVLYTVAVSVMLTVLIAMTVDCAFGWHKAKQRGEARTSYLFSRSLTKFVTYEGILLICTCMDTLIHFAWFQFNRDTDYVISLVTIAAGIVLCAVEVWSMREKADEKTRKHMNEVIDLATKVGIAAAQSTSREAIIEAVTKALGHPPDKTEGTQASAPAAQEKGDTEDTA